MITIENVRTVKHLVDKLNELVKIQPELGDLPWYGWDDESIIIESPFEGQETICITPNA